MLRLSINEVVREYTGECNWIHGKDAYRNLVIVYLRPMILLLIPFSKISAPQSILLTTINDNFHRTSYKFIKLTWAIAPVPPADLGLALLIASVALVESK